VRIYQQIIAGIDYIHQSGVCHRDLKPENLLLDYDKTLKIVDFGLSNLYEPPDGLLKTACGSPCYAAPEMIAGKKYRGLKTDIWSAGVILYAMVAGFLPFEDPKTSNLYKKILAGDFKIPKFLSTDCAHLLSKILEVNPEKRYSIEDIRSHPWYRQFKDKAEDGLFPQKEFMPFNNTVYEQALEQFGFDADYTVKCIEANRHNSVTAAYHLMYKKA
jgi:5'-AMP-activated protein kinase, catalytic alpha subunit